ncbi:MAG: peptide-methionine (S)-S-oxide reductase MsrA, partial [Alphaproteobacteria bacterium]|nr:peptide-methionine (S)-S-oxide reductase MsrA [Alphaproteobacteria bacterium]
MILRKLICLALVLPLWAVVPSPSLAEDKADTPLPAGTRVATFAGGCFWCVESDFDHAPGVLRTVSGYTGGTLENPSYGQVTAGGSGHREAVQIFFDPKVIAYRDLVEIFWRTVDPTDAGGQFCDRGFSYTTAIFANSPAQERIARASKSKLEASGILKRPVVTPILRAGTFY